MRRKNRIGRCRSPLRKDPISRQGKKDYKRERRPEIYKHCARKMVLTVAVVSTWLISAATPGVPAISYKERLVTRGLSFTRSPRGRPIPPAAPNTATFRLGEPMLEMHLICVGLSAADTTDLFKRTATDLVVAVFFTNLTSTTTIATKKPSAEKCQQSLAFSSPRTAHAGARQSARDMCSSTPSSFTTDASDSSIPFHPLHSITPHHSLRGGAFTFAMLFPVRIAQEVYLHSNASNCLNVK